MGTTTLQISLGEGLMARLGKWRSKRKYPPEKSNDAFVREMVLEAMDREVPDVKVSDTQVPDTQDEPATLTAAHVYQAAENIEKKKGKAPK